jgi:perosamine synthetase
MQGALGVAQMERAEHFFERKRRLSLAYDEGLEEVVGIERRRRVDWADTVCWLYTVLVDSSSGMSRDELIDRLYRNGIESRPAFYPLHQMPPYRTFGGSRRFPVTTELSQRGMSLPSAVTLSPEDVSEIVATIRRILGRRQFAASTQTT